MPSFDEVQFPADISYGARGGPECSTDITEMFSGKEQRNINWSQPRARYTVSHGVKTPAQLDDLIAFFRVRQGRAIGFRFKDWTDYQAFAQNLGTGNGTITQFQLVKKYTSSTTITRTILKPVNNGTLKIYLNAVLQSSGFGITVARPLGLGLIPAAALGYPLRRICHAYNIDGGSGQLRRHFIQATDTISKFFIRRGCGSVAHLQHAYWRFWLLSRNFR